MTEKEETIKREQHIVQAKDRELSQAQQQLRQQVSLYVCVYVFYQMFS